MVIGLCNVAECMCKGVWNDSFEFRNTSITFHGEGFACACLTVGKYGPIVAFKNIVNDMAGHSIIDINLVQNQKNLFKNGIYWISGPIIQCPQCILIVICILTR